MIIDMEKASPPLAPSPTSESYKQADATDNEVYTEGQHGSNEGLKQQLNTRHLTFISLGSVIGTGIFLGIGSTLTTAGPVGLVLAYTIICSVVSCVMLCTE